MTGKAIVTEGLRKLYGEKVAVKGLTLEVEKGEVFGFLGPNGAGKTTSIKMLLDLVSPTAGKAVVLGSSIGDWRTRMRVGFLPEHFQFHDWLNAREFLYYHGRLNGMKKNAINRKTDELLEMVGLTDHQQKHLKAYSKGMLQRIGIAQALINSPELVFLDEPTSGLDPVGRRLVRDLIRDLKNKGTTIFLNSHFLSEVEVTCDRVAFIKFGEVLRIGELDSLIAGRTQVVVKSNKLSADVLSGLRKFGTNVLCNDGVTTLSIDHEEIIPELTRYLVNQNVDVYAINPQRSSLEDLFMQIVGTDGGL